MITGQWSYSGSTLRFVTFLASRGVFHPRIHLLKRCCGWTWPIQDQSGTRPTLTSWFPVFPFPVVTSGNVIDLNIPKRVFVTTSKAPVTTSEALVTTTCVFALHSCCLLPLRWSSSTSYSPIHRPHWSSRTSPQNMEISMGMVTCSILQ